MSSSHSNFMGGECYELFNPIQALRLPLCSQFLGEPSYYMPTRDKVPAEKAWGSGRLKESETKQILEKLGKHVMDPKYYLMSRSLYTHSNCSNMFQNLFQHH